MPPSLVTVAVTSVPPSAPAAGFVVTPTTLALIGADDPEAMLRHTDECRNRGIPFIADPSQQLAFADGPFIRKLVDGADYLITNEYESHLTSTKTGWSQEEIDDRVTTRVITLGRDGAEIRTQGEAPVHVPVAGEVERVDPTGVGDAFRAGFLVGLAGGLSHERCAQIGSVLAAHVLVDLNKNLIIGKAADAGIGQRYLQIARNRARQRNVRIAA